MSEKDEQTMDKINELILDISKGSSFSSSAMAQFVELQSQVDTQESTLRYLRDERKKQDDRVKDLNSKITKLEADLGDLKHERTGWRARESELQDRESQAEVLSMTVKYEQKRVEDHQNMVGMIFRNTELRKTAIGQEMQYQPGCVEIRDEYGNVKQYAEQAGFVGVPVQRDEVETEG